MKSYGRDTHLRKQNMDEPPTFLQSLSTEHPLQDAEKPRERQEELQRQMRLLLQERDELLQEQEQLVRQLKNQRDELGYTLAAIGLEKKAL